MPEQYASSYAKVGAALAFAYSQETNISLSCFWDAGWTVRLGDPINGWGEASDGLSLGMVPDEIVRLVLHGKRAEPPGPMEANASR